MVADEMWIFLIFYVMKHDGSFVFAHNIWHIKPHVLIF